MAKTYLDYKIESTSIYRTDFEEGHVVWTPLPWSEYRKYREARDFMGATIDIQLEESIFNKCVLYSSFDEDPPEELSEEEKWRWTEDSRAHQDAGIISSVVKNVLSVSGTLNPNSIIEVISYNRQAVANIEDQLIVFICNAFPAYTPEMVEAMEWATILKRAAQAEMILQTEIQITDPEEERVKAARAQKINIEKEIAEVGAAMGGRSKQDKAMEQQAAADHRKQMGELRGQYLRSRGM